MLKDIRAGQLAAAHTIVDAAKLANRDLTAAEKSAIDGHVAEIGRLDAQIKAANADQKMLAALSALPGVGDAPRSRKGYVRFDGRALASKMIDSAGEPMGLKQLAASGATLADIELVSEQPITAGRPVSSLFDVIPSLKVSREFAYLTQSQRVNNAAFVAVGQVKPTSVFGLDRVTDHLRVVATLSERVDQYWLSDSDALRQFISDELNYALGQTVENAVINGDGVGETPTGILNTSGIQVLTYSGSTLTTMRNALTEVETVHNTAPGAYVLSPRSWAAIETSQGTNGYALHGPSGGSPIDLAARQAWGNPVIVTNNIADNVGLFLHSDAVQYFTDGQVNLEFSSSTDNDFLTNSQRARCETRAAVGVLRPSAVVRFGTAAA